MTGWTDIAGLRTPMQHGETGFRGRSPLLLAVALLMAGFAGLVWIGIIAGNPNVYIRAVSGWLLFP